MKPYLPLGLSEIRKIATERELTNFYFNNPEFVNSRLFWNFVDIQTFASQCPEVTGCLRWYMDEIKGIYLLKVLENTPATMHIDDTEVFCRLNWPILNGASAVTQWYDYLDDEYSKWQLPNNVPYIKVNNDKCRLIGEYVMETPAIVQVRIPHRVLPLKDKPLPRVMLSVSGTGLRKHLAEDSYVASWFTETGEPVAL